MSVPAVDPPISAPGDSRGPIEAQRDWWRAFVLADSVALEALSAPGLRFIASTGELFDRAGAHREALSHTTGARLDLAWTEERALALSGGEAVMVIARLTEKEGRTVNHYRFSSVMERPSAASGGWRVVAAQRTREIGFTPRISAPQAGNLASYAGRYSVPSGAALIVAVQDSALTLTDPNGAVLRLEPIGPAVFESTRISGSNGIVRFTFARDHQGRVIALSRLIQSGIATFPRTDP